MRFLSVCSGIEAASVAWEPLGWKAVAFSEIEPFPCAVLAHHYPDTPNWGDMTKYKDWPDVSIDLLCGGTPCQSFSVAGLRKGLDDPRGNLMLTFGAIAAKYRPQWLVWENVPGVLSSNGGRDFGAFLGMLGQLGYGFAYKVCDAQYHGVAQRRRRVFVVGCLGDWRSAAAVLFERHSLQGHPAPSRQARQGIAGGIEIGPAGGSYSDLSPTLDTRAKDGPVRNQLAGAVQHGTSSVDVSPTLRAGGNKTGGDRPPGTDVDTCETLIAVPHAAISPALKARDHKGVSSDGDGDGDGAILVPMSYGIRTANTSSNGWGIQEEATHTLDCAQGVAVAQPVAFTTEQTPKFNDDCALTLTKQSPTGGGQIQSVMSAMQVRRLTPTECERLQGFPDGYTAITHRNKLAADGPRYKALGNSWAVPCITWLGKRIEQVEEVCIHAKRAA